MSEVSFNENDSNQLYVPGDLLWTKIGSHPFWPCMVTYDPFDGSYVKCVKQEKYYVYHVQFFGENVQRGWTFPGNTIPFQGEQSFQNILNELQAKRKAMRRNSSKISISKLIAKYKVQSTCKAKWRKAVNEAEEALKCADVKERFKNYVFNFENVIKKKSVNTDDSSLQDNTSPAVEQVATGSKRQRLNEGTETANISKKPKIMNGKSEVLCDICEQIGVEFTCNGFCEKSFHVLCMGMTKMPENFKCAECSSGDFSCFSCNSASGKIIKCCRSKCPKYYHPECLTKYQCHNKEKNACPLHTCVTCYRENPRNIIAHKGTMVKCIKCPVAFHSRESCIAAGSKEVTDLFIICPYHFVGKQRTSLLKPCNMNLCTSCGECGNLVCCEACPNAFHESCLETGVTTDDFICEDCKSKRYLLYGMIVWVKLGNYRWWPSEIVYPSKLPDNIKNKKHCDGEFAIQYFGTYDYSYTHSGCTFPYDAIHKKLRLPSAGKYKEQYKKGLQEAAEAYDKYHAFRSTEILLSDKPDTFKNIKTNKALPPAQITTLDMQSLLQCSCDPSKENMCGLDSVCLNRSMLIECHPEVCAGKDRCQNQKFQNREYASTEIIKTKDRGWGLAALQDIKKGVFIIEYVGEVITHNEYHRRSDALQTSASNNYYFLYLDSRRMIDAGPMGNSSRFINHSCDPNCEMLKWSVNGDARIGIFALKDIVVGEELTFDYQSDKYEFEQRCFCAASNCKGFIGRKSLSSKAQVSSNKQTVSTKYDLKIAPKASNLKTYSRVESPVVMTTSKLPTAKASILKPTTSDTLLSNNLFPRVQLSRIEDSSLKSALPMNAMSFGSERMQRKRKSSPPSSLEIDASDNRCFTCENPGTLVLCDKIGCIRAYHLRCVNLSTVPPGDWICPRHFCNICKKEPVVFCDSCPTAFCVDCWRYSIPSLFICQICEIKSRRKV